MPRNPITRRVSMRTAVHTLDGAERPYPVYRFSGRQFFERPRHNPFEGLGTTLTTLAKGAATVAPITIVGIEDETTGVPASYTKIQDDSQSTFWAMPNANGLANIAAFAQYSFSTQPQIDALNQFADGQEAEGSTFTGIRITAQVEFLGTLVSDAPVALHISMQDAVIGGGGITTFINGQGVDPTAADYLGATIAAHANQAGINTYTRDYLFSEQIGAVGDAASYTGWDHTLFYSLWFINREGATASESLGIRLYDIDFELIS